MAHDALWGAITAATELENCHDAEAAVAEAAAAPRHGLSPWALWMLIAVALHLRRQRRVDEIVRRQLGVGPEVVARSGWQALPECRAALRMMHDPDGAARAWQAAHPLTEEHEEWGVRVEVWIRERMHDLSREVGRLRRRRARGRTIA